MSSLRLDTPFLIIGSGSSGTTLLSILLDRHPQIACGPEISVFNKRRVYEDFHQLQNNIELWLEKGLSTDGDSAYRPFFFNLEAYFWEKADLVALAKESTNQREFFDRFFASYLEKRGKQIWGEKTLSNAYCVKEFLEVYPDARIIHMVRDARDVMCSVMSRGAAPYQGASTWLYNVSAAFSVKDLPGYMEIRYEDLVTDPENQMRRILSHIGVDYDPIVFAEQSADGYWNTFAGNNLHKTWNLSPLSGGISSKSVGQYKQKLTADVETLLWKIRLTPFAQNKLGVNHNSVADLMLYYEYVNERPKIKTRVEPNLIKDGIVFSWVRFKREYLGEKSLWIPLTWVSPF